MLLFEGLSLSKEASVKLLQGGKKGMTEPQIQWDLGHSFKRRN